MFALWGFFLGSLRLLTFMPKGRLPPPTQYVPKGFELRYLSGFPSSMLPPRYFKAHKHVGGRTHCLGSMLRHFHAVIVIIVVVVIIIMIIILSKIELMIIYNYR